MNEKKKNLAERISISLPGPLARRLDDLVEARGFANRSQAIRKMITTQLNQVLAESGSEIMAGTITIFYDETKPNLRQKLAQIQRDHIDEVISSQHVLLENNHTMEVLLVQGPARRLHEIADELVHCKGVTTGGLNLSSTVLPPIHVKQKKGNRS